MAPTSSSKAASAPLPADGLRAFNSSVTMKALMALSGFVWVGFLVAHLGSNLQIYGGPETLNDYYAWIESNTVVYWGVRVVLLASLLPHVVLAFLLARRSWVARGHRYHMHRQEHTSWAAKTMIWTGPLLLAFIVFHLLHLTVGVMPAGLEYRPHDKYNNIVSSLSLWPVALLYVLGVAGLGLHLWHGVWSGVRSLGGSHPRVDNIAFWTAHVLATLLVLGFASIPVAVTLQWIG